jgi:hypothetical protein
MADPITIGIAIGAALVTGLSGFVAGRRRSKPLAELEADNTRLLRDKEHTEKQNSWLNDREEAHDQQVRAVTEARDKYRAMAETHEVKLPKVQKPTVQTGIVWGAHKYGGHPEANLKNLAKELKPYKGMQVRMTVTIDGNGWAWTQGSILAKNWQRDGKPARKIGPYTYSGPAERVFDDFQTFIKDDDTGLMKRTSGRKKWADEDSPLAFLVELEVTEVIAPPPLPEIHRVEVPVIERVVEIIEVERPIFVSVPEGQEPEMCGHTREELQTMVREVLARDRAEEEVEALGELVEDSPQRKERLAKLRQRKTRTAG